MGACVEPTHFASLDLGSPQPLLATDTDAAMAYPPLPGTSCAPQEAHPAFAALVSPPRKAAADDGDEDPDDHGPPGSRYYLRHLRAVEEPPARDPRDEGTADAWVERSPSLLRLTGRHPFNGEPPLPLLTGHGFVTPGPLHYVRNHGAVPRGDWATWTVEVTGLVRRPARLTMEELAGSFRALELPVTLACSSGRRKKQNMARQTLGFNWGPGAVSTFVLRRCGGVERGARYVCFEGTDDLPGGGGGGGGGGCSYGTSIALKRAMDPTMDVMLAYMQNGGPLLPDHGFPVRLIVPGCTAGRMVKWLRRIVITTAESDNYYHYRDNRFLPSHVDVKLADAEARDVINEMNVNSVITTPGHGDILPINAATTQSAYTVRGFAYSGAGKKVTRVDVTLDGGETWLLCALDHPEKPTKFGKYWCWCFWSVDVEVADLLASKEIAVRAWDQSLNTQPENLTWNLMGMMTNCWFRVRISVCRPRKGEIGMVFDHPVQPGNQPGGWMARQKHLEIAEAAAAAAPRIQRTTSAATLADTTSSNAASKFITMSEDEHPEFLGGGRMTQYLDSLPVGSYVDVKGPLGRVEYLGRGGFAINGGEPRRASRLAMVAGGSGITPIYQVIRAVLRGQPEDETVMHLVYANRTEDDILLPGELDRWAAEFPDRLKVWYVIGRVRRPEEGWGYSVGVVTEDILREHLPEGGDGALALACGPPPMIQFAVSPNLEKMGYDLSNSVIVF
ncbi:hypothetical protein C2845_PM12G18700 [Panicum miliaceum]|uniref:Nitrate reductase n=1 Tax=Panicum miliaceum TaxID=4540 RepID=A0A3L6QCV2_PANMI|nr:hypothetical protein C2845_PM12G18700 [Panicum miliaceum]